MYKKYKIEKNPKITEIYTVFSREFGPEFRFRGEIHDFWELVCVTSGQISVAADSQIFTLKKGQAILHSPMQFHNITAMENTSSSISVFSFSGEDIPELQNQICEIRDLSAVKTLVELANKYYKVRHGFSIKEPKNQDNSHLIYVKQLELFLLTLTTGFSGELQRNSLSAENYSVIVETINNNLDKRLSVTEIAALCNMSDINLQKTFSRYAGVGVMEYFNRVKMRKATELLEEGLSVKETALRLGFHDQNYFSTVFKRIIGFAPSGIIKTDR